MVDLGDGAVDAEGYIVENRGDGVVFSMYVMIVSIFWEKIE